MTKIYLRTWYPGSFVSEHSTQEVGFREVRPKLEPHIYSWQYFERETVEVNGETLLGEPKNHSPTFYIGKELTAEEAIRQTTPIGVENIRGNRWTRLVITKLGQMFPLNDGDIVVDRAAK